MPTRDRYVDYVGAIALTLGAFLLRLALGPALHDQAPFMLFLTALILAAWRGGLGPSIVSLSLGAILADVAFVPPRGSVLIHDPSHLLAFCIFVFNGTAIVFTFERTRAAERSSAGFAASQADESRLYSSILESMGEGVFVCDRNGRHILSNRAMERMIGRVGTTFTIRDSVSRYRPVGPDGESIGVDEVPISRALRGEPVDEVELSVLPPEAEEAVPLTMTARPLMDERGEVRGAVATVRNVTAQRRADRETRALLGRIRKFIELLPIAAWIKDADGRIEFLNRHVEALTGLPAEAAVGKVIEEIFQASTAERLAVLDRVLLATGEPVRLELTLPRADGSVGAFIVHNFTILTEGGGRLIAGAAVDVTELREAERRWREGEARFRAFMDHAPFHAWCKDATGRFTYANNLSCKAAGCDESQLLGKTDHDVYPAQAEEFRRNDLATIDAGHPIQFTESFDLPDGGQGTCISQKFPFIAPDGGIQVGGVSFDITPMVRAQQFAAKAEAELRESEARFQAFMDNVPAIAWIKDGEGRHVYRNRRFHLDLGTEGEDWRGKTDFDFWPQNLAATYRANDLRVAAEGPIEFEEQSRRGDEPAKDWLVCKFPIVMQGGRRFVAGIGVDITARKAAETALAASEARFREFMDHSPVLAWVKDSAGRMTYLNRAVERAFGIDRRDWLGKLDAEIWPPEIAAQYRANDLRAMEAGRPIEVNGEVRSEGRVEGDWWMSKFPFAGPDGRTMLGGIALDISELKAAQAALAASETQFRAFLDNSPMMIFILDPEGHFVYVNRQITAVSGVALEEWIGKTPADFVTPETAVRTGELTRRVLETRRPVVAEIPMSMADGNEVIADVTLFPLFGPGGDLTSICGIARDMQSQRAAEHAARESRAWFDAFLENCPEIAWAKDEQGRYVYVNRAHERGFGIKLDDWRGKTDDELWPRDIAEEFRRHDLDVLNRHEALEVVERTRDPDERERTWHVAKFPFRDASGNRYVGGVGIDITDRERMEKALTTSEARFRQFMDHSPAAAWIKDEEGRVVFYNRTVLAWISKDLSEVVGRPESELLPETAADYRVNDLRVLETGTPRRVEEHFDLPGGGRRTLLNVKFPLADGGGLRLIGGMGIDITELRQAEQALRDLNAVLELRVAERTAEVSKQLSILDASTDFIATATPQGEVIWANRAAESVLGHFGPEGRIRRVPDAHPPDSARRVLEEAIPAAAREGHWLGETELYAADGRTIPVSQLILVHRRDDGRPRFLSTIMRDITDRKRLEAELRQHSEELALANAQLVRASRMKDAFLATMSHELRTPLNGIMGFSESLEEGVYGPLNEGQQQCLAEVKECGEHLLSLINDILDVAKIEAGRITLEPALFDVRNVALPAHRLVKEAAGRKGVTIDVSIDESVGAITADARRLKQVLFNLLSNALKFTKPGGRIGLDVVGDPGGREVRFEVWDTSIGISPEGLDRLFQPFVQLDSGLSRQYGGTGLGLVLVKRLTELHGGEVRVKSDPGKGSRFILSIPRRPSTDASAQDQAASTLDEPGPPGRAPESLSILVIDDDPVGSRAVKDFLEHKGYEVHLAGDAAEGIAVAQHTAPAVILMDIQMPGMSGLEAIRQIRKLPGLENVPIIALTAMAMRGDRERTLDAGATGYISKPATLSEVYLRIEEAIRSDPGGESRRT